MGLFKPAWKSKNREKALKAAREISSDAKLMEVATKSTDPDICQDAIKKITNQAMLKEIALGHWHWMGRLEAVGKITDQTFLLQIVSNAKEWQIKKTAIQQLTDQTLLKDIALGNPDWQVQQEAVKKITDQEYLKEIVAKVPMMHVRREAINGLTDQAILKEIFVLNANDYSDWVCEVVISRIVDNDWLADMARNSNYSNNLRMIAARKTDNEALLESLKQMDAKQKEEMRKAEVELQEERAKKLAQCAESGHDWDGCFCRRCRAECHDWIKGPDDRLSATYTLTCSKCGKETIYWKDGY